MQRPLTLLAVAFIAALAGFVAGWASMASKNTQRAGRVVAVSWGDSAHAKAFYGAFVYLRRATNSTANAHSVRARVYLGRESSEFYDCGELGQAQTHAEAVARWGNITWQTDGLHIGTGTNQYFLSRAELEKRK